MNGGMQQHILFWPCPGGSKGHISLNFKYKDNFKVFFTKFQIQSQFQSVFFYQNLCVFSQIKDIKHIERDFYSVAWDMPWGGTWE